MASSGVVTGTPAALYAPGGITGLQTLAVAGEIDVTSSGGTLRLSSGSNGVKQINSFTSTGGADDLYLAVNGVAGGDVITGQDVFVGGKPAASGTLTAGQVVTAIPHTRDNDDLPTSGFVNTGLVWTYSGRATIPAGGPTSFTVGQTDPLDPTTAFQFQAGDEGLWMLSVRFPDYLGADNDVSTCSMLRVQKLSGFTTPIATVVTSTLVDAVVGATPVTGGVVTIQNSLGLNGEPVPLFCINTTQPTPPSTYTSYIFMAFANFSAFTENPYIWSLTKLGV